MSPGAISYQVKQLETSLDTPLFHRRIRQVELTDAGFRLYRAVHRMFQDLDQELSQISPQRAQKSLTVSVSTYFVTRWLSPRLGKFLNANPNVIMKLQHSVNDPDFSVEQVDLAIRWGDGHWPDSRSELLMKMPMIAVCSSSLPIGDKGVRNPADLTQHTLLRDQPGMDRWPEWLQKAGLDPLETSSGPVIVDPNVRVQSAIDGHGVVLANPLIQPEIDSGHLVEPLNIRLESYGYYLVYRRQGTRKETLENFRSWLHEEAALENHT